MENTNEALFIEYINIIKENLKRKHAAVFVGAGFSKNAIRKDGSNKKIPLWDELTEKLCSKLGISIKENSSHFLNPLTIAQQVEEEYGKAYLNDLLREIIDDDAYIPGEVHDLLVALPWSDIFTTNYDTLIERAYEAGTKRRYKVIYSPKDLLYSAGIPRIVKLHGSFPSTEPFVISEEDYRKYPRTQAPFVNTVQQSMIENLLVLIGFSGADPNFLQWLGWIRDNFGTHNSPKIYMVLHKHELEVSEKALNAKNINLLVLDDIEKYKDKDYESALKSFLHDLESETDRKAGEKTKWPIWRGPFGELTFSSKIETLNQIHLDYPGWVTVKAECLPNTCRLIKEIEWYLLRLAHNGAQGDDERIYEFKMCVQFAWLCTISGTAVEDDVIYAILDILDRHKEEEGTENYIEIELFVLRNYRIMGCNEWNDLYRRLNGMIRKDMQWNEQLVNLYYENAMHALYSFQWDRLEDLVRLIPAEKEHGGWVLKKAGLLSLLGYHKEALKILKEGIGYARQMLLRTSVEDVQIYNRLSSIENSMISLFNYISDVNREITERHILNGEVNKEERNLESYDGIYNDGKKYPDDYIWDIENEKLSSQMKEEYTPQSNPRERLSFDLGRTENTIRIGDDWDNNLAIQFVLFRETTGHPFHIGCYTKKSGLTGAIATVKWQSHRLALLLGLLEGEKTTIKIALTRKVLADMSTGEVDVFCRQLIYLCRYCMRYTRSRTKTSIFDYVIQDYALFVLPEAISRLTKKCTKDLFAEILSLWKEIYNYDNSSSFCDIGLSVKRIIEAIPYNCLEENIDKIWDMDNSLHDDKFPDPFSYILGRVKSDQKKVLFTMKESDKRRFQDLISKGKQNSKEAVFSRLVAISLLYKLSPRQKELFKKVIWANENINSNGLPKVGDYFETVLFDCPRNIDDMDLLKRLEKSVVSQYKTYTTMGCVNDYTELYNLSINLIKCEDFDKTKSEKAIQLALEFCEYIDRGRISILMQHMNKASVLCKIDELVGMILIKSGLATKEKSINDSTINRIIEILDTNGSPHSLLSWCVKNDERRCDQIIESAFQSDYLFRANATASMYHLIESGIEIDRTIIDTMTYSVATSLDWNSDSFIPGLEYLVRKNIATLKDINRVSKSLPKWDRITKILLTDDEETATKKILTRTIVTNLAKTLYCRYEAESKEVPLEVLNWKNIAENEEEFAEIRRAWDREVSIKKETLQ